MNTLKKSTSKKKEKSTPRSVKKTARESRSELNQAALIEALGFMKEHGLHHFEYRASQIEIALTLGHPGHANYAPPSAAQPVSTLKNENKVQASVAAAPTAAAVAPSKEKRTVTIDSPFVGTFYRAPGPNQDSFVEVGQIVDKGQALCIIEAMKLMNEIESDCKGRVLRVLVDNATPVEFGEPLFEIEPL